ncbi:hypothetical protein RCL1_007051 [Eukaryota sp. TZLM3-RCL]
MESELSPLLIAFRTPYRSFYVPGTHSVSDISLGEVMIDSGCGTVLFNTDSTTLEQLARTFPHSSFYWYTAYAHGVAEKQSLILQIEHHLEDHEFTLTLDKEHQNFTTSLKSLRFHLGYEDVEFLINNYQSTEGQQTRLLNDEDWQRAKTHIAALDALRGQVDDVEARSKIGAQRKHSLLGNIVLENYDCIQIRKVLVLLEPKQRTSEIQSVYSRSREYCKRRTFAESSSKEMPVDEDHDGADIIDVDVDDW